MSVVLFRYKLKKYARWKIAADEKGALEEVDGTNQDISLTLYNSHHLVISHNGVVQENVCLLNSRDRVQVLWHEDNLQVHVRLEAFMHKFRLKFAPDESTSGRDNCLKCCNVLTTYVPIKDIVNKVTMSGPVVSKATSNLLSPVPISQMATMIYGGEQATLPLAYRQMAHPEVDRERLESAVKLCLSDSSFPSFVAMIDSILKEM